MYECGRFEWEKTLRRIEVPTPLRAVKAVGLMLATYADADGTNVRPGERRLSLACQMSVRTVRDALGFMRLEFLLYRVSSGSSLGAANVVDVYRLTRPSDWETRFKLIDFDP